jgi:glycosyltransferase involved in cell wall biosynthesis
MTAYIGASTIKVAVESVLVQSFEDFHLIVLDDGSTDETASIVSAIADPRLTFIAAEHHGRGAALNAAIAASNARYIALNDADDQSLPDRLSLQVAYLQSHPEVDVVGGSMRAIEGSREWTLSYPTEHQDIRAELDAGKMPIANACVMFTRDWFERTGGFATGLERLEDFQLYFRHRSHTEFAAVPQTILTYTFRTFSQQQWQDEENQRLGIAGSSTQASALGYLKYRLAVWSQQHGLGLTNR